MKVCLDCLRGNSHHICLYHTYTTCTVSCIDSRKQIRRDNVVMKWIKRSTHIYSSDSDEEQHQEEVKKEKTEEEEADGDDGDDNDGNEEKDSDDDNDRSTSVTSKTSCNSKQQNIAKKKPVRTPKHKNHNYNELYKKAVRASGEVTAYRASRLPFILRFSKLLGILYLAVLLAEEDILLSDIIR